jgi:hypothetical protein
LFPNLFGFVVVVDDFVVVVDVVSSDNGSGLGVL